MYSSIYTYLNKYTHNIYLDLLSGLTPVIFVYVHTYTNRPTPHPHPYGLSFVPQFTFSLSHLFKDGRKRENRGFVTINPSVGIWRDYIQIL